MRYRQVVEFLDLGETDIHLRAPGFTARLQQLRQAMQGLRSEYDIHIGCPLQNRRAFLAGNTAAHRNQQIGIGQLERAHPAQIGEHLFFGLLAYRAGIEQYDIGLFRLVGRLHAFMGAQHIRHLVRVILVHLAAESV